MATIVVIFLVLFHIALSEKQCDHSDVEGLWFQITSGRYPFLPSLAPCVLRGRLAVKRDDYTYTPGAGAHKFHLRTATWNDARRTCESEGGHLAVINSIAESNAIADVFQKSGYTNPKPWAYIGFHDLFQEGEYLTVHGQSVAEAGFTGWLSSDPNGGTAENCGAVDKDGALVDIWCDVKIGFICELPVD